MNTKFPSDQRFANFDLPAISHRYNGKVRDIYETEDGYFIAITSDRVSAFDHILPLPIPHKGIVLNKMSQYFFEKLGDIVPHWFLESPHPRVLFGYACKRIDIEVIVRNYLAGSLWRAYKQGERIFWGSTLPDGMVENQELPTILITPTTKAAVGHDENITEEEIIVQGLCTQEQWDTIKTYAFKLFGLGTDIAAEKGLILVDTKYEFGIDRAGTIRLIDEVHTPDSSRYFYANEYKERLEKGEPQHQLSKEFVREFLMSKGFEGKDDQEIPQITHDQMDAFQNRYCELLTIMTGLNFESIAVDRNNDDVSAIETAIMQTLRKNRTIEIGIIMGSDSDLKVMQGALDILDTLCIGYEVSVVSAHRTPDRLAVYANTAIQRGIKVIVAGAGGAAHLPGMVAAYTTIPVIGVPVKSSNSIDGWDSVLSILQMPAGVPVATVALNGAANAGILAAQILSTSNNAIAARLQGYKKFLETKVNGAVKNLLIAYPHSTFQY